MDAFSLRVITYIIDLLMRARLRLATELQCLCLASERASLSSGFLAYNCVVLFGCVATNRSK